MMYRLLGHMCAVGLAILIPAWAAGQENLKRTYQDELTKIRGSKSLKVGAMGKMLDSKLKAMMFECHSDDPRVLTEIKSFLQAVSPSQYEVIPGTLASGQWVRLVFFSNPDFTGDHNPLS